MCLTRPANLGFEEARGKRKVADLRPISRCRPITNKPAPEKVIPPTDTERRGRDENLQLGKTSYFPAKAELRSALHDASRCPRATGAPTGFGVRRLAAAFHAAGRRSRLFCAAEIPKSLKGFAGVQRHID